MVGCQNLPSVFPSFTASSTPAHSPDPNSVLPKNRRMPSQRGVATTIPKRRLADDMETLLLEAAAKKSIYFCVHIVLLRFRMRIARQRGNVHDISAAAARSSPQLLMPRMDGRH